MIEEYRAMIEYRARLALLSKRLVRLCGKRCGAKTTKDALKLADEVLDIYLELVG